MPEELLDTTAFDVMSAVVPTVMVIIVIAGVILVVLNVAKVRKAGHNPLTLDADLAVRALDSELLAPARSIEDRLRELDDLHARGVITAEERARARSEVLSAG